MINVDPSLETFLSSWCKYFQNITFFNCRFRRIILFQFICRLSHSIFNAKLIIDLSIILLPIYFKERKNKIK